MTPAQRDTLTDAIADALSDRNDIDVTFPKFAEAVVEMLENSGNDVTAALLALLAEKLLRETP